MKKNRTQKDSLTVLLQEQLHLLSYQAGIAILKALLYKMETIDKQGSPIYSVDQLEKEDKKILVDLLKLQVLADRKIETSLLKTLASETGYDS